MPRKPTHPVLAIYARLADELHALEFGPPAACVYNPLRYAWAAFAQYVERYSRPAGGQVLLLGMNPGPFGMAQTGVPFGEVELVRSWMGIEGTVGRPPREHPSRPVEGFGCTRSEVSGARVWGWARDRFGTPERFFARFFVMNYCPLAFLEASGRNRTPDKLAADERAALFAACDRALAASLEVLRPRLVVGVGGFACKRAEPHAAALEIPCGTILHPSPASPLANAGWAAKAEAQLAALGVSVA